MSRFDPKKLLMLINYHGRVLRSKHTYHSDGNCSTYMCSRRILNLEESRRNKLARGGDGEEKAALLWSSVRLTSQGNFCVGGNRKLPGMHKLATQIHRRLLLATREALATQTSGTARDRTWAKWIVTSGQSTGDRSYRNSHVRVLTSAKTIWIQSNPFQFNPIPSNPI